eukprot:722051-Pleurochrysis_carterae.AAC.2
MRGLGALSRESSGTIGVRTGRRQALTPRASWWKCASDPTATLRGVVVSKSAAYEADCHRSYMDASTLQ